VPAGGDLSAVGTVPSSARGRRRLGRFPWTSRQSLATPDTIVPEREPAPSLPVMPMNAGDSRRWAPSTACPARQPTGEVPVTAAPGTRSGSGRGLGEGARRRHRGRSYGVGNGVTAPDLVHRTQPQYSADAMRAKLQGVAVLTGIVGVDAGSTTSVSPVRSTPP
jgi:hypothetical protein